jgi:hypothetical protein
MAETISPADIAALRSLFPELSEKTIKQRLAERAAKQKLAATTFPLKPDGARFGATIDEILLPPHEEGKPFSYSMTVNYDGKTATLVHFGEVVDMAPRPEKS